MLKHLYQFPCPCCGKRIEIDTRSGRARAVVASEGHGDLEDLLDAHKQKSRQLGEQFESAREDQRKQQDQLDDLFRKAKDDARQNPDEELRRPFDLD